MQSGGFTVYKAHTEEDFEQLRDKAASDLRCAKDKLEPVVDVAGEYPNKIGLTGGGQRVAYIKVWGDGWVVYPWDGAAK